MSYFYQIIFVGYCLLINITYANDVLHRGNGPEPQSLHIHQAQGLSSFNILRDLYEGLFTHDAQGKVIPGVAKKWTISDDQLMWRFQLHKDAHWSNGEPLLASHFVTAWQQAINPATAAPYASLFKPIQNAEAIIQGELPTAQLGITKIDQHTLEIKLAKPLDNLPQLLTHPVTYPIYNVVKTQEKSKNIVSNGAYQLKQWSFQEKIELTKNPYYYQQDQIKIETVVYHVTEDAASELKRYRAGDLHMTETIPSGQYQWLQENLAPELNIASYLGSFFYGFKLSNPTMQSKNLRKALSLAIDRDVLVKKILGNGEQAAYHLIPNNIPNYQPIPPEYASWSQNQREQLAKQLYNNLTSENQLKRIKINYNSNPTQKLMAVAIAAMWKKILGIQATLNQSEWKSYVNQRRQNDDWQVFRAGWIADFPDASNFLALFQSKQPLNVYHYQNSEFDHLLSQIDSTTNNANKQQLITTAESLLLNDHVIIPLFFYVSKHLVKPNVGGFKPNGLDIHLSRYLFLTH